MFVKSQITGTWYNELCSKMTIACQDGHLSGKYYSAVGKSKDWYDLNGYCIENKNYTLVGFSVRWMNEQMETNAITTWNGQLYHLKEGDTIQTQWMLVSGVKWEDRWISTTLGHDEFVQKEIC